MADDQTLDVEDDDVDGVAAVVTKKRRGRLPRHLSPEMRQWVNRLAMILARINYAERLVLNPTIGGQEELIAEAKEAPHILILDAVNAVEWEAGNLLADIEAHLSAASRR